MQAEAQAVSIVDDRPPPSEADVLTALRQCFDPCCREKGISVVDMGLIDTIAIDERNVRIEMVLTSGWCPFAMHLLTDMEQQVVWNTTWTPERLSSEARRKLSLPLEQLLPLREARIAKEPGTKN
jgi:metal-sulfur cluster biosynthetic enzyme